MALAQAVRGPEPFYTSRCSLRNPLREMALCFTGALFDQGAHHFDMGPKVIDVPMFLARYSGVTAKSCLESTRTERTSHVAVIARLECVLSDFSDSYRTGSGEFQ